MRRTLLTAATTAAHRHPSAAARQRHHRHHRRWRVQRRRNLIKKGAHVKLCAKPPCRTRGWRRRHHRDNQLTK
jgi:hypothetical protein